MLRQKQFVKKTKSGKVLKVVKEHYLRDDIWCSVETCKACDQTEAVLTATPSINKLFSLPHYIIPDTNIFMNQIDVMEKSQITNVIVLQTVLEEVKHLSLPIHKRVRDMISNKEKRFFVFSNEHHRETFIEKLKDETPNDRNDRAIRVATKWYGNHIKNLNPKVSVVMMTDDVANRAKAEADGLQAVSVRRYIEALEDDDLLDMMSDVKGLDDGQQTIYEEHLSPAHLSGGIKSGKYYQGKLSISGHNYLEGSIFTKVDGVENTILIVGREHLNRAVDGDIIAVELLPKSEWRRTPTGVVIDEEEEKEEEENLKAEQAAAAAANEDKPMTDATKSTTDEESKLDTPQPCGKIVGIIRRNWRQYCGFVDRKSVHTTPGSTAPINVLFYAMESKIPKIKFRTRQAHNLLGKRVIVSIDSWPRTSRYPIGHFIRVLGDAGDKSTETEVLLLEHDVPFHEFSKQVLSLLPEEGENWVVKPEHFAGREDFRSLNVCSIDPPGCTDIDDALHVTPLPNGNYQVGVHIADVTHFVKAGNVMDQEAASRGTTVYLVDKRIDMLPSLLGTNLCSLRSNVERLSFSCIWELNEEAEIVNVRFTKSVIASKASLTYEEAQNRIDDERMQDDVTKGIRTLNMLAKKLKKRRLDMGALTLASPEVRFSLERDTQDPVDVEMKELKETNALVEEFMLLANISVAGKIYEKFPNSAMLRCHPTPPAVNFEKLEKAVARLGITIDHSTSKTLSDSLDNAVIPEEPYFNKLLRIMTTRCMMQALYFCSGSKTEAEFRHYGLATNIYTHFTSPIRRYSDVMVHRQLHAAIDPNVTYGGELTDKDNMDELCGVLNHRNRMAQQAGRSSVELFTHLFFKNKVEEEEGYVIRILKNAFIVLVPKYGIEGIVYASAKTPRSTSGDSSSSAAAPHPILVYNPETDSLQSTEPLAEGQTPKSQIQLFQKVMVQISIDDDLKGGGEGGMRQKLKMDLLKPWIEGISVHGICNKDDPEAHACTATAAAAAAANGDDSVKKRENPEVAQRGSSKRSKA
ncbi:exosome catalytic subunit dis3 [Entomortierella chlamydospora]|uniref:Ribosomal RNA-processing protein 44 n=1 Tax=Entomortierella chlamydospora TaxID=101097 RepID=A0A9P6MRX6_9FUNG|nr:exosome catalytic subunit dis3 [Entomortierella chlamydospora]KAG0010540.1 exosome catalytic subunit dis3 [Entomortierella chlamydospora]